MTSPKNQKLSKKRAVKGQKKILKKSRRKNSNRSRVKKTVTRKNKHQTVHKKSTGQIF